MTTPRDYDELLQRVTAWAFAQADIHALILLGSRARSIDHPADQWSDLDLIAFVADLNVYARDAEWLAQFGSIAIKVLERSSRGDAEWLIVYENGLKIDVLLAPSGDPIHLAPYEVALQYGQRVLFDKTHSLPSEVSPTPVSLPDQAAFISHVQHFWLEALRAAKLTRRGDLWRAKFSVDGALKRYLLTLMEWHTLSIDSACNIWHDGRFLAEWLDRDAHSALPATFAAYDPIDLWRALVETIDLFRRLAQDTARRLDLTYPRDLERHANGWLAAIEKSAQVD
ncbi:MAG: aminoglycoside 6-adenylyltransferase [Anaerolineae bacterium]